MKPAKLKPRHPDEATDFAKPAFTFGQLQPQMGSGSLSDAMSPELPILKTFMAAGQDARPGRPEGPRGTGTTTLGITTKDTVVMGTDHRASAGTLISHTDTQKLFRIDNHLGLTIAGLVGDAQTLVRQLTAEAKLFSMKHDRPMPVKAAASMMANMLNQRKWYPYEVALIVGGWDRHGPQVYSLDEAGGSIPDKWTTTGSGSRFVFGVLEDSYRDGLTTSDAIDLGIRGLNASTHRDSASGNGFDLATIDGKKGFQWVPREEVDKRLAKMGLPPIPR
jgi:proteasome beta subunit